MEFTSELVKRKIVNGKTFYEYGRVLYPERLTQGNAKEFIEETASKYCQGLGLDIGANIWSFNEAIPIRNDVEQNAYKLDHFEDEHFDYIFSSHCLEHLDKWEFALKLWIKKLKLGGILFLYLPHESMKLWRVGSPWVGTHKWIPCWEILIDFLVSQKMEIIEYNDDKDELWSFHIVAGKT